MTRYFNIATITAATFSMMLAPPMASAEVVGKMTAERATITKAGAGRIRSGAAISQGDRLSANSSGSGMIVFDDESSARLGPNANLVIDDFVYNPARRSGKIKLRQTAGSARIFGGQISKRGSSEVRTPHIVLGVRGGIVDVVVAAKQSITTLRAGVMICRAAGKKRTVTNPGISCVSDGRKLSVVKLAGGAVRFVDPSTGSGTSRGGGGQAACDSNAGIISGACVTRDTGLPSSNNPRTRTRPNGSIGGTSRSPTPQGVVVQVAPTPITPVVPCINPPTAIICP